MKSSKFNIVGNKYGHLTVISQQGKKSEVLCDCENYTKKFVDTINLKKGTTTSCGCYRLKLIKERNLNKINSSSSRWSGYEEISGKFFNKMKNRAVKERKLDFTLMVQEIWDLFIKQNRKCALSGLELSFNKTILDTSGTASLDRIDSSKGYVEGNVQWVHKQINEMKMDQNQLDFINFCKLIANFHK